MIIKYSGPTTYYDIQKFQAVVNNKEVGYTSFSVREKELYIELVSAKKEYRGKGVALNTFMLAIAYSECDSISTTGMSASGRPFLESLERKGLIQIINDNNMLVTSKGKAKSVGIYKELINENKSYGIKGFQDFLLELKK